MRLPNIKSQVYYAYSLSLDGVQIGTIKTFTPSQARTHEYVREIALNGGTIKEGVPGVTDYTIRLEKVSLFEETLYTNFGIPSYDIQSQVSAVDIREEVHFPPSRKNSAATGPASQDPTGDAGVRIITWEKCWITEWGKTISTTAITVVENMTVKPTSVSV